MSNSNQEAGDEQSLADLLDIPPFLRREPRNIPAAEIKPFRQEDLCPIPKPSDPTLEELIALIRKLSQKRDQLDAKILQLKLVSEQMLQSL